MRVGLRCPVEAGLDFASYYAYRIVDTFSDQIEGALLMLQEAPSTIVGLSGLHSGRWLTVLADRPDWGFKYSQWCYGIKTRSDVKRVMQTLKKKPSLQVSRRSRRLEQYAIDYLGYGLLEIHVAKEIDLFCSRLAPKNTKANLECFFISIEALAELERIL